MGRNGRCHGSASSSSSWPVERVAGSKPPTDQRAKPAVPFAGVYRLIDFPLSNCQHSGIPDVWVSVQYHPTSLSDHLANGRPWDLDRTTGGLMMLPPPFQGTPTAVAGSAGPPTCSGGRPT